MKKKILAIIISTIVVISLYALFQYTVYNLKSNSVYYAKNMPRGEGQEPEIIMLVDNLEYIKNPDKEKYIFDIDGTHCVKLEDEGKYLGNLYSDETMYTYSVDIEDKDLSFWFNRRFELKIVFNKLEKVSAESIDKNEIISGIKSIVKPIIEAQPKPKINLQWLFNLIYADDFK